MSRTRKAVTARLRLALAIIVGGAAAVLVPSLFAMTVEAPSSLVVAALATALAAIMALNTHVAAVVNEAAMPHHPRAAADAPSYLAGRVTDPVHHPRRPRAPGAA